MPQTLWTSSEAEPEPAAAEPKNEMTDAPAAAPADVKTEVK